MTAATCPRHPAVALVVEPDPCMGTTWTAHCPDCCELDCDDDGYHGGPSGSGATREEAVRDLVESVTVECPCCDGQGTHVTETWPHGRQISVAELPEQHERDCDACDGSGGVPECAACRGKGEITKLDHRHCEDTRPCQQCDGLGYRALPECAGKVD